MTPFYIKKNNIYAIPITHYNMEMAAQVRLTFLKLKPSCVAVELPETFQNEFLHAASRLPDISVVSTPLFYMCEPCDASFEGLRSAMEAGIPAYCIDLDVENYPNIKDPIPDPYAIQRVGLSSFFEAYERHCQSHGSIKTPLDADREMHMAKKLKELSLQHDTLLFIGGMTHISRILDLTDRDQFPTKTPTKRESVQVATLTENSCREVMAEFPWMSSQYEKRREELTPSSLPDRQKLILKLLQKSAEKYTEATGNDFPSYNYRNIMKFLRNYSLIYNQLMPDLYQILVAARGCVDHNFAYEVWNLATDYPHRKNVDNLKELDLSVEDVWGKSKIIRFHPKQPSRKAFQFRKRGKDRSQVKFTPPGPFSICSYPPEDLVVEGFADFLKKKGTQIFTDDSGRTAPFSTSIEDGIDTRETIRHWHEKKLYVKIKGKPPGGVGSIAIIFDEDAKEEKYPWKTTWLGEHSQESDMAFYATSTQSNVVGPGISRCEYGGFMMSYPPRRMFDIWSDPDYEACRSKSEVLLMAAIDYAVKPLIVYVASKPPRTALKSFASRFGKKIVFLPIGQLSPIKINKIRAFHVLDGYDKRQIADEYIY